MLGLLSLAILSSGVPTIVHSKSLTTYRASFNQNVLTKECLLLEPIDQVQRHRLLVKEDDIHLTTIPAHEETDAEEEVYQELFGSSKSRVMEALAKHCDSKLRQSWTDDKGNLNLEYVEAMMAHREAGDEIVKLVDSGLPENRIDIVFMGDGYTQDERSKFMDDMTRMTDDMFTGSTFAPYLPLFNVWALFRPSTESGLGTFGKPKNTAFQLYRQGTELRGVYCAGKWAARNACKSIGPRACDFPSLIANDDFYGGLGGEFTISTSSPTSGTLVLRHEMGHNFGRVGEEYDGGQVYSGANSVRTLRGVSWKHWLSTTDNEPLREEHQRIRVQSYPWYDLSQGPKTLGFDTDGTYVRWKLQITVSNMTSTSDLHVTLDGQTLEWNYNDQIDRSFYSWTEKETGGSPLSKGSHVLRFESKAGLGQFRQLCSVILHEFKGPEDFHMDDDNEEEVHVGAYPTWNIMGTKSYRPTNDKCLMRNMQSTEFCPVCLENMWLKFFERVDMIDDIEIRESQVGQQVHVVVHVIPLGQFRATGQSYAKDNDEHVAIRWFRNNELESDWNDQVQMTLPKASMEAHRWEVEVEFQTPMVRKDTKKLLTSRQSISI